MTKDWVMGRQISLCYDHYIHWSKGFTAISLGFAVKQNLAGSSSKVVALKIRFSRQIYRWKFCS